MKNPKKTNPKTQNLKTQNKKTTKVNNKNQIKKKDPKMVEAGHKAWLTRQKNLKAHAKPHTKPVKPQNRKQNKKTK